MKRTHIAERPRAITSVLCVALGVVFCSFGIAKADTTTVLSYEFLRDKSTVVLTGGIMGAHETYAIQGGFGLRLDGNGGAAFEDVDATFGPSIFFPNTSLEELFNMTGLTGSVIDATTIKFVGWTASSMPSVVVRIDVTFQNNLVRLTGRFDENDAVCDGFCYKLSAVARVPGGARPGDTNGDDIVDEWDYKNLVAQFRGAPGDESADFNRDGRVDLIDLAILRSNFSTAGSAEAPPGSPATIPEPATLVLMAAGLPLLLKHKRRK